LSAETLTIDCLAQLLAFNLDADEPLSSVVLLPSLSLPRQEGLSVDATFEFSTELNDNNWGRRHTLRHPKHYGAASFSSEVRATFEELKLLTKRGKEVVWLVDPNRPDSLFNACSFLSHCYPGCYEDGPAGARHDVTYVPFPWRRSRTAPHHILWHAIWPEGCGDLVSVDDRGGCSHPWPCRNGLADCADIARNSGR
jgi:hypothetical protein